MLQQSFSGSVEWGAYNKLHRARNKHFSSVSEVHGKNFYQRRHGELQFATLLSSPLRDPDLHYWESAQQSRVSETTLSSAEHKLRRQYLAGTLYWRPWPLIRWLRTCLYYLWVLEVQTSKVEHGEAAWVFQDHNITQAYQPEQIYTKHENLRFWAITFSGLLFHLRTIKFNSPHISQYPELYRIL